MITCPQCGGQNLPGMAYCENCGSPLPQAGAASAPVATAYAPSGATISPAGGATPSAAPAPSASAGAPSGLVTAEDPAAIALPQPVMPVDQPLPGPDLGVPSPPMGANGVVGVTVEPLDAPAAQSAPGTADLPQLGSLAPQTQTRAAILMLTFPTGQTFSMQGDEVNVGRADVAQNWRPELDVIPYGGGAPDLGVSRHHARVMRHDNGFAVADVGSTNGTYVNGRAMPYNQPISLNNGDTLSFGALNTQVAIS